MTCPNGWIFKEQDKINIMVENGIVRSDEGGFTQKKLKYGQRQQSTCLVNCVRCGVALEHGSTLNVMLLS